MSAFQHTHLRVPYYRPRTQGGDTQHPLCCVPIFGWAGARLAAYGMSDSPAEVTCPHCRRDIADGGVTARRDRLARYFFARKISLVEAA